MEIKTQSKKNYKTVEVTVTDGGTKMEYGFYGKKEIEELKEQLRLAIEDCDSVLEFINELN